MNPGSIADGKSLCDIPWPKDSLIASIRRNTQVLIPHGNTLIQAEDHLTVICKHGEEEEIAVLLSQVPDEENEKEPQE